MFSLIIVVSLILFVIAGYLGNYFQKRHSKKGWILSEIFFWITLISAFACVPYIAIDIALLECSNADEQIEEIEQENTEIENTIYLVVQYYIEHEGLDLKIEKTDVINEISNFPELEPIFKEKIEHYNDNTEKIDLLKKNKEQIPKAKWELYFGH